jgi:small-conductance mechanosensitive channel
MINQTAQIINEKVLNYIFLNNTVLEYLIAVGIFFAVLIALKVFKMVLLAKIKKMAKGTETKFDDLMVDVVDSVGWSFYFFFALFFALKFISVPEIISQISYYVLFLVGVYYAVKGFQELIEYGFGKIIKKRKEVNEGEFDPTIIIVLKKISKIALWGVAVVIFLQNLGYDITALVAGLGIGGLAIAFALQNILGDIFSSFTIYFDKPFQVGDFIIIGNDMGVVEKIGIKSTRIRTLQGQELVVSNQELTSTRINNYKKMQKRRIVFGFGVIYDTPVAKIKKIPQIIKEIAGNMELVDLDRVHFNKFGDFSLNFEVVYYLGTSEYNTYMDVQQEMNLAIKEAFEKEGIEFAYPTQTVYLNK